ncbi:hypothetical protein GGH91_004944, partial [Coemansia sp. RSA 2671]
YFLADTKGGKTVDWPEAARSAPGYAWLGGVFGGIFVLIMALVIHRRGAAITNGIIVVTQLIISVIIDATGGMESKQRDVTGLRGGGLACMVLGIALKVTVLSEAKFKSGVDAIVQRDFFPSEGKRRKQGGATLEEYLRTHTSEDNARFQRIVGSDKAQRDERHSRVFGSAQGRSHGRSGLLLEPRPSAASASVGAGPRVIVAENTRLAAQAPGEELEEDDTDDESVVGGYRMLSGGFRLAAPSPRELVALRLGKRPTRANASSARLALSPAAHRLLQLPAAPGRGSDLDLRRAYGSPR